MPCPPSDRNDETPASPPAWEEMLGALRAPEFAERTLPAFLRSCRWFGGKAREIRDVQVVDAVPLASAAGRLALLRVNYTDATSEIYLLPLQVAAPGEKPATVIARVASPAGEAVLFDALDDAGFRSALFEIILAEKRLPAGDGAIAGHCGTALKSQAREIELPPPSRVLQAEQSNSSVIYDGRFFLKLYRKPEAGENPDAELLRFLSERQKFAHVPAYCGSIEHRVPGAGSRVLALLVANVPNQGDAWTWTLDALAGFYERARSRAPQPAGFESLAGGTFPARVRQLGERTAQMHLALAADHDDPNFTPEPFTSARQRELHESMTAGTRRMIGLLDRNVGCIPARFRDEATALLTREDEILRRFGGLLQHPLTATRTRHHGDYHLGQVLETGSDFVIIDFEGEPARSLSERREKRSPLRDVAGMLRSFDYAAHTALARHDDPRSLDSWARIWSQRIGRTFLDAYLATARGASFLPADAATLAMMLEVHLLEKAAYEVCYELNNRPDWIFIPLRGITRILDGERGL